MVVWKNDHHVKLLLALAIRHYNAQRFQHSLLAPRPPPLLLQYMLLLLLLLLQYTAFSAIALV
eukprot:COSAG06_NODE_29397_length_557_cov_1.093886_1_plen_62_part_01